MTRLSALPAQRVIKAMAALGFAHVRTHGSHYIMRRFEPHGRCTIPLHDTVAIGTLRALLREAGVSVTEFTEALK